MRTFPLEYEAKKEILFYPERPERVEGHILEIGPGRGDFILSVAEENPDRRMVAIELGKRRYFRMIPRIEKRGLNNLLMICGNARIVIPRYIASNSFDKVYVLFPDPWPKKRHIPHRLMTSEFMELLAGTLRPGGELYFATDYWPYASWVAGNARHVRMLESLGGPHFVRAADFDYYSPTFFEQKWRNEGRSIYYMKYGKI